MEDKYKKYLEFSWKDSNEWQSYFTNIFPTPPGSKVEKYKRKFYKFKIDPDFDVNYDPQSSSTSSNTSQQQSQQQYYQPQYQTTPATPSALLSVETLIMFVFAFSVPFNFHSVKFAAIAYLSRTFRICGKPQWNAQYAQMLLTNDTFHIAIYCLLLMVDRFNYYLLLPIAMRVLLDVTDNLKVTKIQALAPYMKYCDIISNKRYEILSCKAHVEVAIGFLMIIGIFFKINSLILPIAYWQFMKMKYIVNPEIKNSWSLLNQYVDNIKRNPSIPQVVTMIIDKVQWGFQYMGKVDLQQGSDQQGTEQNANSGGGLGGCTIF